MSVMISIKPKWCELIASGRKTIEVRKTRPKLETPFKCYIYCTKDSKDPDRLWVLNEQCRQKYDGLTTVCANLAKSESHHEGNGKVIGEFVCDNIFMIWDGYAGNQGDDCLTFEERENYLKGDNGYGWHISDLVIYDEPRGLGEFVVDDKAAIKTCRHRFRWGQPEGVAQHGGWIKGGYCCTRYSEPVSCEPVFCENYITKSVSRPPQSWCYVEGVRR